MNTKNLLTIGLLLFVSVAVVILVTRELGRDGGAVQSDAGNDETLPDNAIVAYYFHGETRCPTCRNIESYSREAIEAQFSHQLASGEIQWRVVNYELPENPHFATEYEIVSPTVVLVRTENGEVVEWSNLARVWELVGEKDAFAEYVQQQTQEMLDVTAG